MQKKIVSYIFVTLFFIFVTFSVQVYGIRSVFPVPYSLFRILLDPQFNEKVVFSYNCSKTNFATEQ